MGLVPGAPKNCLTELFLMMRMADQMKLVRKPPQSTTMRMGRFCQRSRRWLARSCGFGDVADGLAGGEAEGEEAAHDAGEDGDGDALAEGEVGLARLGLLFGGDLVLFRPAGGSVDGDGDEADERRRAG